MIPVFVVPEGNQYATLFASGILGAMGQVFLTMGYKTINARTGSMISSSRIVFAALMGFLIFSEIGLDVRELMTIEINPKAQGRGLGFKLLTEGMFIIEKREPRKVLLHVSTLNEKAINMYRKFDFNIVKSVRNYYNIGQSAYLMHKEYSID
jgi:ribosomal-protein-alanine N-acetyltransferase